MYTYCIHIVYTCHNLLGACHNLQTACHNLHKAGHNLQVGEKLHPANLAEYPKRAFWSGVAPHGGAGAGKRRFSPRRDLIFDP